MNILFSNEKFQLILFIEDFKDLFDTGWAIVHDNSTDRDQRASAIMHLAACPQTY
jgi:hypothetical protein